MLQLSCDEGQAGYRWENVRALPIGVTSSLAYRLLSLPALMAGGILLTATLHVGVVFGT